MNIADLEKTIRHAKDSVLVPKVEWLPELEWAVARIRQMERNDYREPLPPLTGSAPDDEPEAA